MVGQCDRYTAFFGSFFFMAWKSSGGYVLGHSMAIASLSFKFHYKLNDALSSYCCAMHINCHLLTCNQDLDGKTYASQVALLLYREANVRNECLGLQIDILDTLHTTLRTRLLNSMLWIDIAPHHCHASAVLSSAFIGLIVIIWVFEVWRGFKYLTCPRAPLPLLQNRSGNPRCHPSQALRHQTYKNAICGWNYPELLAHQLPSQ